MAGPITKTTSGQLASPTSSYTLGFYIQDDNDKWIDFSSRVGPEQNRLAAIGTITHTIEKTRSTLQASLSRVTLDNSDGMFDKPFPTLIATDGTEASFSLTINGSKSVIYRHKVKITLIIQVSYHISDGVTLPGSSFEETTIGVFLVDDGTTYDSTSRQVTLKLATLAKPLMEANADIVRNGRSWYTNRPVSFLVEELLKVIYDEDDGTLPVAFNIQKKIEIPTTDGTLALSHFGPPPEWDGTIWQRPHKRATAIIFGTVGGISNKLWMGLEDEIWYWDPTTETSTQVTEIGTILSANNYIIRKMWIDSNSILWGVACEDEQDATYLVSGVIWNLSESSGFTFTEKKALTSVYTGAAVHRPGNPSGLFSVGSPVTTQAIGIGQYEPTFVGASINDAGENPSIPFSQSVRVLNAAIWAQSQTGNKGRGIIKGDKKDTIWEETDLVIQVDSHPATVTVPSGFVPIYAESASPDPDELGWFRYWMGSEYCFEYSSYGSEFIMYFTTTYSVTDDTPTMTIHYYKLTDGTDVGVTVTAGAEGTKFPTAIGANPNGRVYVGLIEWDDTGSTLPSGFDRNDRSETFLHYLDLTAGPPAVWVEAGGWQSGVAWPALSEDRYWMITELYYNPTSTFMVGGMYNRATHLFGVNQLMEGPSGGEFDWRGVIKITGPNQYKGFAYDSINDDIIFYEVGTGRIWSWPGPGGDVQVIDHGTPAVYDDSDLLSGLTIDNTGVLPVYYGISSPGPNYQSQEGGWQDGKYYLFQAKDQITDRIELADFEGLSVWEAITKLCQAVNCVAGFNEEGNFFLKSRTTTESATADYTVGDSIAAGLETDTRKLSWSGGEDDVYNVASVTPNVVEKQEANSEIRMVSRATSDDDTGREREKDIPLIDFYVDVRTVDRKTIRAVCTTDGKADHGDSRWKYLTTEIEFEVRLVQAAAENARVIYLSSLYGGHTDPERNDPTGIQVGDFASAIDPDTDEVSIHLIEEIDPTTVSITLDAGFGTAGPGYTVGGFDLPVKTPILIIKRFNLESAPGGNRFEEWSDVGITYVSDPPSTGSDQVEVVSARFISIGTILKFHRSSSSFMAPGDYRVTAIAYGAGVVSGTDVLTIDPALPSTGSIIDSGAIVRAWWSPPGFPVADDPNGQYSEIGGTGIFVKFTDPFSGTEDEDWTKTFRTGDVLMINAPGLELIEDEHAKQKWVSMNSINRFGRKEYPTTKNRFVGRRIARQLAGYYATTYREPTANIKVVATLRPDIHIIAPDGSLAEVDVYSPDAFPYRPGFKERCLIRSISHDLNSRRTTFLLKAITPY